ncbi:CAAX amino terminal protease self- immunity [compost metagenome]
MRTSQWVGLALLASGYAGALMHGQFGIGSIGAFALLLWCAGMVLQKRSRVLACLGHGTFVILTVALALHLLPGFFSARVIDAIRFTPDATPFTMYLNLDKPLIGFWLLLVCPWIIRPRTLHNTALGIAVSLPPAALVCFGTAMAWGIIAWAPKWPEHAWLWAFNNLLLVSLTEEALFRGYIQGGLGRLLGTRTYGSPLALIAASVLFGLAHIGGGWQWVLLATLAGVAYGVAYHRGGLAAAVSTHFGFNLLHFGLFTYPVLSR